MTPYYQEDGITIYHGDCLSVMESFTEKSIATVATDPPYSSGARQSATLRARKSMRRATGKWGKRWIGSDNLTQIGFSTLMRLFAVECRRVTRVGGHFLSWIDWRQWPTLAAVVESAGWTLRGCLVWDKQHFGMGNGFRQQAEFCLHASHGVADNFVRHDLGTVYRCRRPVADLGPTQKPLEVVTEWLSALPDGRILDPFVGSGTTLVAAKSFGRPATGIDDDEEMCEIAAQRLSQGVLELGA